MSFDGVTHIRANPICFCIVKMRSHYVLPDNEGLDNSDEWPFTSFGAGYKRQKTQQSECSLLKINFKLFMFSRTSLTACAMFLFTKCLSALAVHFTQYYQIGMDGKGLSVKSPSHSQKNQDRRDDFSIRDMVFAPLQWPAFGFSDTAIMKQAISTFHDVLG